MWYFKNRREKPLFKEKPVENYNLNAMTINLEKYKKDLEKLIKTGELLLFAIHLECHPEATEKTLRGRYKEEYDSLKKKIPIFRTQYQSWYSEALVLVKQLLPDRLNNFISLYEKPKNRKKVEYGNYVIEDYLQNLQVSRGDWEIIVSSSAAIPQFEQQLNIVISIKSRFESSLFDITQLVQADLFDSELDKAKELNKHKFERAAGAIAGVVLERHLKQVCQNHNISISKKNPTINDLNELLKNNNVIDTPQWRFIQHLGDIRNLCDHNKEKSPTQENVTDLIVGVEKITKTIF